MGRVGVNLLVFSCCLFGFGVLSLCLEGGHYAYYDKIDQQDYYFYGGCAGICSIYAAIFGFVASLKRSPSLTMMSAGTAVPAFVAVAWLTKSSYERTVNLAYSGSDVEENNAYIYYYMSDWGLLFTTTLFMLMQMACLGAVTFLSVERFVLLLLGRAEVDDRIVGKKRRAEAVNRAFDDDRRRNEIIQRRGYDGQRRVFDRESGVFDRRDS